MSTKQYKRTLVTTALPYANGPVHIGHLAGVYVPADIYVRYKRMKGEEILFIGGSDEHGVPIALKAKAEGVSPQEIVDRYHKLIKESFARLGIDFDIYSRTTSDIHRETAQAFFTELYESGKLIEQTSEQYYDPEAKQFLADRYITGTCPHCHNEHAYGDQCESCGTSLSATDLINPRSAISGAKPELRETKHWYLPLGEYETFLRKWILDGHKEWKSNVYGQCKSWPDLGLQPRAVTRDLDWGIPVPLKGAEGKVLYVWFDAPIGYISNTKELLPDNWRTWWSDPETRMLHFIGKDNIVFHCIIFPAMLRAEGTLNLPDNVPANEFLNLEGDKISTSRNWAIWLHEYLDELPGKEDVLRYVLTANAPETKDNDFTWADYQARNNNELVAIYGNFVNRALVLTHKHFDGKVPPLGSLTELDREMLQEVAQIPAQLDNEIEHFHFREALKIAMQLARVGNKYLADTEPWKVIKSNPARVGTILHLSLQLVANLSIAFAPFTPFSTKRLRSMLQIKSESLPFSRFGASDLLSEGHQLGTPELLFEKIEDALIQEQLDKLAAIKKSNEEQGREPEAVLADVPFDTFAASDLRAGRVVACEKVPKADKLLRFSIDDGLGGRTIVSGIAAYYKPEELVGKTVAFVANLPVRKIRGVESQGMILSVEDYKTQQLRVVTLPDTITPGSKIV